MCINLHLLWILEEFFPDDHNMLYGSPDMMNTELRQRHGVIPLWCQKAQRS